MGFFHGKMVLDEEFLSSGTSICSPGAVRDACKRRNGATDRFGNPACNPAHNSRSSSRR